MSILGPNKRSDGRFWLCFALCTSFFVPGRAVRAESFTNFYNEETLREAQPILREDVESLFKVVRRHLSPQENQRLGNVRLEFPLRTSDPFNPLNFYSDTQERIIRLPVQTKVFLSDLMLAYVWLTENGYQPQTVFDYAGMVGYYSRKSMSDRHPKQYFEGQFPLPLPTLQIPQSAAQSSTVADNRAQKLTDAIIFGFCHELGHVYYQHPPYAVVSAEAARANEAQADAFAVEIMRRISRAPLGTVFFFMTVAHLNGSQGEQLYRGRTHPLTGERLQMLASAMEKEAADFAKNESDRDSWSNNIRSLAAQLRTVAMTFEGPLRAHAVQVSNLRPENIKERLAPRRSLTYVPSAPAIENTSTEQFSGAYDCDIWLVLQGQTEGQIGGGPLGVPPLKVRLILRRRGDMAEGEYTYIATGMTGRLKGKVDGDNLAFAWNEPPMPGFPPREGTGLLHCSEGGLTITGDWGRDREKKDLGKWKGKRAGH